ncbi:hypothetical protein RHMOL_Rhmol02G0215500 [Rhododendron molle]|uniref:Uncharacterized protein n=1 Tax=Rhododendron molle TaxID=49168 RepID=A0ACC0PSR5_RHOML|nr:hypothetical protein RHMOL_Rhmol02G0215500 [Rhododendron molle]
MLTNGKEFNERMTFNLHEYQWHLLSVYSQYVTSVVGDMIIDLSHIHQVYFNGMLDTVPRHGHLSLSDVKVVTDFEIVKRGINCLKEIHWRKMWERLFHHMMGCSGWAFQLLQKLFPLKVSGKFAGGIVAPYTVYKGKAALSAAPVLPTFSKLDSGGLKVHRRGSIMLTFWPASGERKYDWEKRQRFALSATEVGSLISLASKDSCEFFHDPSMLSSNAGQVRKTLSVKPNDSGYFISLSVVNNIQKTNDRFSVPVTSAEFAVMRTAFSVWQTVLLPYLSEIQIRLSCCFLARKRYCGIPMLPETENANYVLEFFTSRGVMFQFFVSMSPEDMGTD